MIDDKIKIGILGHGISGKLHREVIEDHISEMEVVALADSEKKSFEETNDDYELFSDYSSLVRAASDKEIEVDAYIVALPINVHKDSLQKIAEVDNKPLLMEKPLSNNYQEAQAMEKIILEKNVKCMVGMTGRFHPEFQAAFSTLSFGDIGDIITMEERIHFHLTGNLLQYVDRERGVGLGNGIHTFDRLRYFSSSTISRIDGKTILNKHFKREGDDYAAGVVVLENGLRIPFSLRWTKAPEEDYVFQITGTEGTITVRGFQYADITRNDGSTERLFEHDLSKSMIERHKSGLINELKYFTRFIKGEKQNNFLEDALAAQKAVELLYGGEK